MGDDKVYDLEDYMWLVVMGGIMSFAAAFGIGANDVANAYATSVGSKALTVKQACFLAVIFEFLGAFLGGMAVSDTIRKKIADVDCFAEDPAQLMYGCFCVIISVAVWLVVASKLEMPVSTTHSCVGGMIGMAITIKGGDCVVWEEEGTEDNLYLPKGVAAIVLSWVISPLLSAMCAVFLFTMIRRFVLRHRNSFDRAVLFYPILIFFAVWINGFFIMSKGVAKKICDSNSKEPAWCCRRNAAGKIKVHPGVAAGVSAAIALVVAILAIPIVKMAKKRAMEQSAAQSSTSSTEAAIHVDVDAQSKPAKSGSDTPTDDMSELSKDTANGINVKSLKFKWDSYMSKVKGAVMTSLNADPHASIDKDEVVNAIHNNAEKFDQDTEMMFRYIQIFTAICDSFAHGANDVANAIGPYMALYAIYKAGKVESKTKGAEDDALWILSIGGIGIGVGLLLYGYKIMRAIGVKLAVITPSRGTSIELGAAMVIIFGSYLGLPLSTTHCQVGATTGVALLEGKGGINPWVLFKTVIGWITTLVVVGLSTGLLVAQGIYAPLADKLKEDACSTF